MRIGILLCGLLLVSGQRPSRDQAEPAQAAALPANKWVLIHREDDSGGKMFARAVLAENVNRVYLWGTGGARRAWKSSQQIRGRVSRAQWMRGQRIGRLFGKSPCAFSLAIETRPRKGSRKTLPRTKYDAQAR